MVEHFEILERMGVRRRGAAGYTEMIVTNWCGAAHYIVLDMNNNDLHLNTADCTAVVERPKPGEQNESGNRTVPFGPGAARAAHRHPAAQHPICRGP